MKIKLVYLKGSVDIIKTDCICVPIEKDYITFLLLNEYTTVYIKDLQYVVYEGFGEEHSIHNNEYKGELK
jgi:hypothetical protein